MAKKTLAKKAPPARSEVRAAFQELYDQLSAAYWAAPNIEAKDRIYGIEEVVYDALMALDKAEIESNTELFKQTKAQIDKVLKRIDELKRDIDNLIHAVKVAANVAAGIDKAIQLASKFFGT